MRFGKTNSSFLIKKDNLMISSLRKYLLWPFGILYGSILAIRNLFYNRGWLSSYQSPIFTISVGNLSMGGTGKTPMVEYLVRALSPKYKTAILSRGYGRKNPSEVLIANARHTAADLGDEPMQYHSKFPEVSVVVASNRVEGAKKIESAKPDTELIILDDAFQHRRICPHLSILLTDYSHLYTKDAVVPAGNLREFACGAKRAHIIVVSKCPAVITAADKAHIRRLLHPAKHQMVLFSSIGYQAPIFVGKQTEIAPSLDQCHVLLLTGIAKPAPLKQYLEDQCAHLTHLAYRDHYHFNTKSIQDIKAAYEAMPGTQKCLITTEKDWQRLEHHPHIHLLEGIPIAYMPIETVFSEEDNCKLLERIENLQVIK